MTNAFAGRPVVSGVLFLKIPWRETAVRIWKSSASSYLVRTHMNGDPDIPFGANSVPKGGRTTLARRRARQAWQAESC